MPVAHQYKDKQSFFILTNFRGKVITFQLTPEGQHKLQDAGINAEERFGRSLLLDLIRSGDAYTHGTGTGPFEPGSYGRQLELDFSDDPEPETLIPTCAQCNSLENLHLVDVQGNGSLLSILCPACRKEKSSLIDISIPLPFVTRSILSRLLEMRNNSKLDAAAESFQALLDKEFTEYWDKLAKKRPKIQKQLFEEEKKKRSLF